MTIVLVVLFAASLSLAVYLWIKTRRESGSVAWALMALFAALFAVAELSGGRLSTPASTLSHIFETIFIAALLLTALGLFRGERRQMRDALIAERDRAEEMEAVAAELRARERLTESLRRVGATVTASLDLPTVLDTICAETCACFETEGAVIWLLDDDGQMLWPAAARSVSAEALLKQTVRLSDPVSIGARAVRERRPIFVNELQHRTEGVPLLKKLTGAQAILAVPIVREAQALGVLVVLDTCHPQRFGLDDVAIAEWLSVQLAAAVQNARMFEMAQRRARQMALLNEITRSALSAADFHATLQTLADWIGELMDADGCYVTLWDEAHQQVTPAAASGEMKERYPNLRIEPGELTMTESVLTAGHALAAEDVMNSPHLSPRIAAMFPARSLLGLPLLVAGQKLGAALVGFNQPHHFTPEEITLGEQAAGLIALAVARAQLFEETHHRVEMLGDLHDTLIDITVSRDLPSVLHTIVERASKLLNASGGGLYLCDAERRVVRCVVPYNTLMDFTGTVLQYGEGAAGKVAETGQPLIIDDYREWPGRAGTFEKDEPFTAVISVPMVWRGRVTGVIHVLHSEQGRRFSRADLEVLTLFASQATIAVENARLLDAEKYRARELDALLTASKALLSTLELEPLLHNVLTAAIGAIPAAEKGTILLREPVTGQLQIRAVAGYTDPRVRTLAFATSSGYSAKAMRERRPLLIADAHGASDFHYDGDIEEVRAIGSAVVAPLTLAVGHSSAINYDGPIGVISLDSTRTAAFTESDLRLLVAFANTAAAAIEHARLHAEVQALAVTDSLTGIANRRAFDHTIRIEVARAERYHYPLSLLIVDIDSFKQYNDTYGHPAGDKRLRAIAAMLGDNVRDPDMAARYGGEEFALVLPHTNKAGALAFAERLRTLAESTAPDSFSADGLPVPGYTISVGVAAFPNDALTPDALLLAADNAELGAKRAGKNRVRAASALM